MRGVLTRKSWAWIALSLVLAHASFVAAASGSSHKSAKTSGHLQKYSPAAGLSPSPSDLAAAEAKVAALLFDSDCGLTEFQAEHAAIVKPIAKVFASRPPVTSDVLKKRCGDDKACVRSCSASWSAGYWQGITTGTVPLVKNQPTKAKASPPEACSEYKQTQGTESMASRAREAEHFCCKDAYQAGQKEFQEIYNKALSKAPSSLVFCRQNFDEGYQWGKTACLPAHSGTCNAPPKHLCYPSCYAAGFHQGEPVCKANPERIQTAAIENTANLMSGMAFMIPGFPVQAINDFHIKTQRERFNYDCYPGLQLPAGSGD